MTRAYLAFTDTGLALAKRLAAALPGSVARCGLSRPTARARLPTRLW